MKLLRTAPPGIGLTFILPLLAVQPLFAQTDAQRLEALRACLDVQSDAARLLCFESIVSARDAEASGDRTAASATNAGVEPDDDDGPEVSAAPVSGNDDGDAVSDGPVRARPATAEPAGGGARAAEATPERRRDRDQAPEEDEAETIVIVATDRLYRGNATFATDDGRLFVQTSGSTARPLPAVPFEATLEDGALGSRFLVARSAGLRIRVREQTE